MANARNSRDLQFVDHVLTNVARGYKPSGFIAHEVAPKVSVSIDDGKFPVFNGFFEDDTDNKVPDRAETPEIDFTWSEDSYHCEDYRLKASITRKEERNAHSVLRLRQNKLEAVLMRMAIRRERRIAGQLRKTTNGGKLTLGGGVSKKWNDPDATIETDIKGAALAAYDLTGMTTNTIVIPYKVAYAVAVQPDIREILKYTVNGEEIIRLGDRILPSVIHGHRVLIPKGAMRNTAAKGEAKALEEIWQDHVRLLYLPEGGGGWGIPATAYTFEAEPEVVDRWRENDPAVEYVRAWECVDEKVCGPDLGYEIADVL